jgi:hypothetical protein
MASSGKLGDVPSVQQFVEHMGISALTVTVALLTLAGVSVMVEVERCTPFLK